MSRVQMSPLHGNEPFCVAPNENTAVLGRQMQEWLEGERIHVSDRSISSSKIDILIDTWSDRLGPVKHILVGNLFREILKYYFSTNQHLSPHPSPKHASPQP